MSIVDKVQTKEDGTTVLRGNQEEVLQLMGDILIDCVVSISGLKDVDGEGFQYLCKGFLACIL